MVRGDAREEGRRADHAVSRWAEIGVAVDDFSDAPAPSPQRVPGGASGGRSEVASTAPSETWATVQGRFDFASAVPRPSFGAFGNDEVAIANDRRGRTQAQASWLLGRVPINARTLEGPLLGANRTTPAQGEPFSFGPDRTSVNCQGRGVDARTLS